MLRRKISEIGVKGRAEQMRARAYKYIYIYIDLYIYPGIICYELRGPTKIYFLDHIPQ